MKTLEEQIAELTAKHNLQSQVESKLPNMKLYTNDFNYKSKGTKYTFTAKLEDCPLNKLEVKIKEVIAAFPPTQNNTISFAGKDDQPTCSPFVLKFDNGIHNRSAAIDYISGEFWAQIDLPITYYSNDVLEEFRRKVYDTEHHYFGGVSMNKINDMRIPAYRLKDWFQKVQWYGGDVSNFITNESDKERFETIVLTGKDL